MVQGTLIFKTEKQAKNVCRLLNEIKDAEYDGRNHHFYRVNKALKWTINTLEEQEKIDKILYRGKKWKK